MKFILALLVLATSVAAAPVPQGAYDGYGSYSNVPAPPVSNPPPPAAGYGSYGNYGSVPAPAGGYGSYGAYKKE